MLAQFKKHIWRTWKHHATMQVATLAVLIGTYTVISAFALLHQNLDAVLTKWGETVKLSVYLKDDSTEAQKSLVENYIKNNKAFKKYEYISKEKAMNKFQSQMGSFLPDLIFDDSFKNPLPESYEIEMQATANAKSNYSLLVSIAEEISKLISVEDVSYGQGWVENYATLVDGFSITTLALVLLLLVGGLFVIGNSIRSSIAQRRGEIEVLELVGATSWHIKSPFIIDGALMGLVASSASIAVIYIVFSWQQSVTVTDVSYWTMGLHFSFLSASRIAAIICSGVLLGAIGSYLCVRKLNSGWLAAEGAENL